MQIIGLGKITKNQDNVITKREFVVTMTETELDKITGIAGKPHHHGRHKIGAVAINKVYNRVKWINENMEAIKMAMVETKANAQEIEDSIPLET